MSYAVRAVVCGPRGARGIARTEQQRKRWRSVRARRSLGRLVHSGALSHHANFAPIAAEGSIRLSEFTHDRLRMGFLVRWHGRRDLILGDPFWATIVASASRVTNDTEVATVKGDLWLHQKRK